MKKKIVRRFFFRIERVKMNTTLSVIIQAFTYEVEDEKLSIYQVPKRLVFDVYKLDGLKWSPESYEHRSDALKNISNIGHEDGINSSPIYSILKEEIYTIGFEEKEFLDIFADTPYYKPITKLFTEKWLQENVSPVINKSRLFFTKKKLSKGSKELPSYIFPIALFPFIIANLPEQLIKDNECTDICTSLFYDMIRYEANFTGYEMFAITREQFRKNLVRVMTKKNLEWKNFRQLQSEVELVNKRIDNIIRKINAPNRTKKDGALDNGNVNVKKDITPQMEDNQKDDQNESKKENDNKKDNTSKKREQPQQKQSPLKKKKDN